MHGVAHPATASGPSSLRTQVVLIFGSGSLGKAAAVEVLRAGGVAHLVARDVVRLEAARAEVLAALGSGASAAEVRTSSGVDVMNEDTVEEFFATIAAGSVHHLVVTVGASASASDITGRAGYAKFRSQMDMKLMAQVVCVSYGAPRLAVGGSIVLMSGTLAKRPGRGSAALAAANSALESLARGGIRINCISPGLVDTKEIWSAMPAESRRELMDGFAAEVCEKRCKLRTRHTRTRKKTLCVHYERSPPYCDSCAIQQVPAGRAGVPTGMLLTALLLQLKRACAHN
jgi:NAD(P)-dependent dehydrogenase (short-subunit alcohol dehydrogenase family)